MVGSRVCCAVCTCRNKRGGAPSSIWTCTHRRGHSHRRSFIVVNFSHLFFVFHPTVLKPSFYLKQWDIAKLLYNVYSIFVSCACWDYKNDIFTCVSLRFKAVASSTRSGVLKYRCAANLFSNPVNCGSLNTVLAFRLRQCFKAPRESSLTEGAIAPGANRAPGWNGRPEKKFLFTKLLKKYISRPRSPDY